MTDKRTEPVFGLQIEDLGDATRAGLVVRFLFGVGVSVVAGVISIALGPRTGGILLAVADFVTSAEGTTGNTGCLTRASGPWCVPGHGVGREGGFGRSGRTARLGRLLPRELAGQQ